MTLRLTARHKAKLLRNWSLLEQGRRTGAGFDPPPAVKVFTPDAGATWLLAALSPDGRIAYGLADLGLGFVEAGEIDLQELGEVKGRLGLPVEVDRWFTPAGPLSQYLEEGRRQGRLVA